MKENEEIKINEAVELLRANNGYYIKALDRTVFIWDKEAVALAKLILEDKE